MSPRFVLFVVGADSISAPTMLHLEHVPVRLPYPICRLRERLMVPSCILLTHSRVLPVP